jgi:hypothetical protein
MAMNCSRSWFAFWTLLFPALFSSSSISVTANSDETCWEDGGGICRPFPVEPTTSDECKLFMAPSTISNAGLGVFTVHPVKVGETIGYGDVILPFVDFEFHHPGEEEEEDSSFHSNNPFSEFLWDAHSFGLQHEAHSLETYCPGLYSRSSIAIRRLSMLVEAMILYMTIK